MKPGLSILEIDSQLGDASPFPLLKGLHSMRSVLETSTYTVLCQTADSVTRAQEQLVSFGEAVKFAAADDKQGWKDEKFDLVLSFNLTSTAIDPDIAIRNARQLLKEGGEVCLVEITRPGLYFQMLDKSQRSEYVWKVHHHHSMI